MQRVREQPPQAPSSENVQERLRVLFNAGRTRARAVGRPVMVTTTERVTGVQALDILEPRGTNQMYWASPRDGFAVAGVGSAVTLSGKGETRFGDVARAWQQLLDDAVVHDAAYTAAGGPVLMGGFSFDPDGPHSPTWNGFNAACFTIPRLTVTCHPAGCWLTLNAIVSDGQDERGLGELITLREKILARVAAAEDDEEPSSVPANRPEPDTRPDARADVEAYRWRETVRDAVRAIRSGRLEKVVLARAVRVPLSADFDITSALRYMTSELPNTFVYAIWRGEVVFAGASPERLVRLQGRDVSTSVLAGSAPRGETPPEDAEHARELVASAKNRAEHEIVRRELAAALEPVCDDVVAEEEPALLSLPNVHHLHTAVRARLQDDRSVFDIVERLHPTPAVGGAPRREALAFIREREELDRGWYAAPIGWVSTSAAEFAVALRCALVRRPEATLFAGCGIVADSDADAEYQESQIKLSAARAALAAGSAMRAGTSR